jgi:hypothetical protein
VPSSHSNPIPPAVDTWWGDAGMFLVHTALVYMGSISWFPWFVYRWFDVAPFLNIHPIVQRIDWYLHHLAAVNIGFALLVGYGMARAAKPATIWAWAVPLLVLTFQILLFKSRTPGSVFGGYRPSTTVAIEYFFGTAAGLFDEPGRALAQIRITAPFFARHRISPGCCDRKIWNSKQHVHFQKDSRRGNFGMSRSRSRRIDLYRRGWTASFPSLPTL